MHICWLCFWIAVLSNVLSYFCGREGGGGVKILQDSQKNVSTILRELFYAIGGKIPKWQDRHHWRSLLRLSHHFMNDRWKLNKLILSFKRTDALLSLTLLITWSSAVDLHIPLLMQTSGIKRFVQWVPKQLTDEHSSACMEMYLQFLYLYYEEGEAFWIVTSDKTWVHHFEPATKHQSM